MQAQYSALPQQPSGFFALLNSFSGTEPAATNCHAIRVNADYLCVLVNFACLLFALLAGMAYGNLLEAIVWGTPLFLASVVITWLFSGRTLTMHLNAALLVGMGALHVHIARGLIEYHFSFFILLPVMLAYRDIRPLVSMGLFIVIHHIVFDMLQQAGFNCYIFRGPFSGLPAVALHGFYIAVEVLLLSAIAQTLKQHALAAEESAKLLSYLDKEKSVNLRVRAQADEQGKISPVGQVFNTYADNMGFVVASFKMLRTDIRDLSQIAKNLGDENSRPMEKDAQTQAAQNLRNFVQSLGDQTRMGQSAAELSNKITEDCFDLLNELNQAAENLQKISALALDSKQQINSLTNEKNHDIKQQQLNATLSALDNLNERTHTFLIKLDSMKNSLSTIENQIVLIDHATHQWIENGNSNQRRGWEILSTMENMQAQAETAFRTLDNTVQTILRSDNLMREMEKRLSRFDI